MLLLRRFALLLAVGAGAAVLAGPSFAARDASLSLTVGTTHILVHYTSTTAAAHTQTAAGDVAALAERAYTAILADGYPAPPSDGTLGGDARIDIYLGTLAAGILGTADPDGSPPVSTGSITLARPGETMDTIAHELFHIVQFGIWLSPWVNDLWLEEGTAEWMGYRVDNYSPGAGFSLGPNDMALDCLDTAGGIQCDTDPYKAGGYSRWPFFQYLTENYGASFVKDIFQKGRAGAPSAVAALQQALTAKGTTLADVYNNWIAADMRGGYAAPTLQGTRPTSYGATIATGVTAGSLLNTKLTVNHLSTRYLKFTRGDGDGKHACYAATLALSVTLPAGTQSKPVFWWDDKGSNPVPLYVSGNTATASVPWDTCLWVGKAAYLAIPNASTTVDAADFIVTATMTIDLTKPTASALPPIPVAVNTPVVQAGSADGAPSITVFGPELLKLAAGDKQIRLIVESSGQGLLQASLGSVALGVASLRGGNNDVRFTLPAGIFTSLRKSTAASSVLTLTPVSTNSTVTGTAVAQKVQIAPAKPKAKRTPRR